MSKYAALRTFLAGKRVESVTMTFAEIEKIVGFKLPHSRKYPAWWSNNPTNNVMTSEWLEAGYKTEQVDIAGERLVFRRARPVAKSAEPLAARGSGSSLTGSSPGATNPKQPRRHPFFGWMKGMITISPGVDLTEPADPEWGKLAWGDALAAHDDGEKR